MKLSELDYALPPELIAQRPLERRDASRLLVYDRASGAVRHRRFSELPEELRRGELVVVNDTRVVPARLRLRRPGGGADGRAPFHTGPARAPRCGAGDAARRARHVPPACRRRALRAQASRGAV